MISQPRNRVQAIKSKFENLNSDNEPLIIKKKSTNTSTNHLCKQKSTVHYQDGYDASRNKENNIRCSKYEPLSNETKKNEPETDSSDDYAPKPNMSYLYSKSDVKRSLSDTSKALTRQISDPGKKLQRSHAFRCDRSQKIGHSPKRHGSCNGRSETSDFSLKGEKKLSKERLKKLGNLLEDQMRKENFVPPINVNMDVIQHPFDSVPDTAVPQHILDQYAKVLKPKKCQENKQDAMTDSGVSSETENLEDDKGRIKKLKSQFEKAEPQENKKQTNLEVMDQLCASSETMRLERKNPHLILTDTLKKALKQPLPTGPPPKKPPRTFASPVDISEKKKKDTKKMLEKLEQVLQKREAQTQSKNIYDIAETDLSLKRPREMHYLSTDILDITQRSMLSHNVTDSIANCFNSLNCAIVTNNSMSSLPYTRLSSGSDSSVKICCSCSNDSVDKEGRQRLSTFINDKLQNKCSKCQINEDKQDRFRCHLHCRCQPKNSEFYLEKEHIYDVPFTGDGDNVKCETNVEHKYGALNSWKLNGNHSKSLEDLRPGKSENQKIYDIPCEISRPSTPDVTTSRSKLDFEKLRQNFENGFRDTSTNNGNQSDRNTKKRIDTKKVFGAEKPAPLKPKPIFVKAKIKVSKSTENLSEEFKAAKRSVEKKFATDTKRYRKLEKADVSGVGVSKKGSNQLDVDRENLNRLMNEIYETVSAACNMDENKPGSFPTEQSDGSTSEDSVKLTRSLTEKRKNYVRRVSSRVAYLDPRNVKTLRFRHQTSICSYKSEIVDNPYSTFRSWKSFRASQGNLTNRMEKHESTDSKFNLTDSTGNVLSMKQELEASVDSIDNLSIDEKTGCVDIELPFEPRERGLFNLCLLVGLNYMSGEAYVKSVFPSQVQVPPHIENLIFPETLRAASRGEWAAHARGALTYSLVLTDERGERSYGYCRRVLPEGATTCLPLCYCLIGRYRAPGFYYKVLQEIESHHGSSEVDIQSILQQLFDTDFPNPGEDITVSYGCPKKEIYRNSLNLGDLMKCKTMPEPRRSPKRSEAMAERSGASADVSGAAAEIPEFYDLENNNGAKQLLLSFDAPRSKVIKRPIEPRVDEDNVSVLLDALGAGLVIKVFGSLLLERKVIIVSDNLSLVSSCMEALQSSLYPFVWQQPLISTIPSEIQQHVLEAPLPILAGMLKTSSDWDSTGIMFEEGMLIDLTSSSKVLFYQGDESTILPSSCYKTLKTALQMETSKHKDKHEDTRTRNVMISEAFLRFFVDILGDFWRFFSVGDLKDGGLGKGDVVFDKEAFIKNAPSKQNQYFLEWFTDTAMFNHFVQNMAACHHTRRPSPSPPSPQPPQTDRNTAVLVDTPLPNFYELFEERLRSRSRTQNSGEKNNYKNAVNKRVKLLKSKLRDLVT